MNHGNKICVGNYEQKKYGTKMSDLCQTWPFSFQFYHANLLLLGFFSKIINQKKDNWWIKKYIDATSSATISSFPLRENFAKTYVFTNFQHTLRFWENINYVYSLNTPPPSEGNLQICIPENGGTFHTINGYSFYTALWRNKSIESP